MLSKGSIIGIAVTVAMLTVTTIVLLIYFFVIKKSDKAKKKQVIKTPPVDPSNELLCLHRRC